MDRHDPKVIKLAQAIAKAEGFGPPENLPTRINNPGDLELGDLGHGVQAGKTVFQDVNDGWERLYSECWLMLTGTSHIYGPTNTILRVAEKYTGGDNSESWARIVAGNIGVTSLNTLADYLNT